MSTVTYNRNTTHRLIATDVGDTVPVTALFCGLSGTFDAKYFAGKVITALLTHTQAYNGTSPTHVHPIVQLSNDGTNWADYGVAVEDAASYMGVASAAAQAFTFDLTDISSLYMRLKYVPHNAGNANPGDSSTGKTTAVITVVV